MIRPATLLFVFVFLALALAGGASSSAQIIDLSWCTIDGGGGRSTGGTFVLTGTIGQPDASVPPLTGGSYTLEGGFWPGIIVLQTCIADIDSNETVDVSDLLAVINAWGSCPLPCPPRCSADISPAPPAASDCQINVNDLLQVVNSWGPCPD